MAILTLEGRPKNNGATLIVRKIMRSFRCSEQEEESAVTKFRQALAANGLGGEELRSMLENPVGLALAKGLGVSVGEFRKLGTDGKLTPSVLIGALKKYDTQVKKDD